MDRIDEQIIRFLVEDARRPVSEIAQKLGIGRSTAHDRIARLERSGMIIGYTAVLSRTPFEETARAVVMISIVQRSQKSVVQALRALPEVADCHSVSGDCDLIVNLRAPRLEDIDAVLDEILGIDGVERCRSLILLGQQFDKPLR